MKHLVIISGKGGTGKTSVTASLAALAGSCVLADCDVDAADLHLLLDPQVQRREDFFGSQLARIDPDRCTDCGRCAELCRFDAINDRPHQIDPLACEGCGLCAWACPAGAIEMFDSVNGRWMLSQTRLGPMVHAALTPGADNSGKLVHTVKTQAIELAQARQADWLLVDGAPGTGCPVIASIAAADLVLIVTEPTRSGLHDMQRVAELAKHFSIPAAVCINKADINPQIADEITTSATDRNLPVLARIDYDPAVTAAQRAGLSIVEFGTAPAADQVRSLWSRLQETFASRQQTDLS
ncbi:MAG: ATP-binding protein [Phycisphaerae bacterium]